MATGSSAGSVRSRRRSSGWPPKWASAAPMELQVVSIPAISSRNQAATTWRSGTGSPPSSAFMSMVMMSPCRSVWSRPS